MKKASLFLLATAWMLSFALANSGSHTPSEAQAFQGLFGGGNVGYEIGAVRIYNSVPSVSSVTEAKYKSAVQGLDGGIVLGYNYVFPNSVGLALEGHFNWASTTGRESDHNVGTAPSAQNIALKNAAQIRVPLSYVVCDLVAPKVIIGWDSSLWTHTVNVNTGQLTARNTKRFNGVLWGTGVDFLFSQHIVLGLEYIGVFSQNKTFSDQQSGTTTFNIRPTYNTFKGVIKITPTAMPDPETSTAPAGSSPTDFEGAYVGGNLGYAISSVRSFRQMPTISPSVWQKLRLSTQGLDGGLLVGYNFVVPHNIGVGLEAYFNWAQTLGRHSGNILVPFAQNVALKNAFQLRVPFSYILCNTAAPKLIVGWDNASWSDVINFNQGQVARSQTFRLNGLLWGVGVDFLLTKHVISGIEYTGVFYQDHTLNIPVGSALNSSQIRPVYNTIKATMKFIY